MLGLGLGLGLGLELGLGLGLWLGIGLGLGLGTISSALFSLYTFQCNIVQRQNYVLTHIYVYE